MSNAFGNVLEGLKDSKDKLATQDFEDTMLQVNETAAEKTTLFGDIEKGSGTALGTVVGAKAFASQVQKLRQKFKGSNKEELNENEEGAEGVEDAEGVEAEIPEETSDIFTSMEQSGTDAMGSMFQNGRNMLQNLVSRGESALDQPTSNPAEIEMTDIRPQEIEMTDMSAEDTQGNFGGATVSTRETAPFLDRPTQTGDPEEDVIPETEADVGEVGEETVAETGAEVAGETGAEVAGEVGAEVGLEAAGAALDATGFGAILGVVLQGIGIAGAAAGVGAGIVGSDAAQQLQQSETFSAEKTEQAQLRAPPDVTGKFAAPVQSSVSRIDQY